LEGKDMEISAQISLYPLGKEHLAGDILHFVEILTGKGLRCKTGAMSTLVFGDSDIVFPALHEAFEQIASHGGCVMVSTISNACPV
jgi:uncharacterized protein YqgV (UPF0045/DUF77 family)